VSTRTVSSESPAQCAPAPARAKSIASSSPNLESVKQGRFTSAVVVVLAVAAALAWSYSAILAGLIKEWGNDPDYSVGQLVPFAALYMLWHDRANLRRVPPRVDWIGLGVLLLSQMLRAFGLFYLYESAERYSLIVAGVGLVWLLAGRRCVWSTKWVLLFLFLMVPLPGRLHNEIAGPLQGLAAAGAVVILEILGVSVAREGHVLMLNDRVPIAVAEACSGLRMLTAFVVVDVVLAYIVARPRWHKIVLLLAAIPVAIGCNLARLAVTALLFLCVEARHAERFFHDFAGWTMMPLAVILLLGLLKVLSFLTVSDNAAWPRSIRSGSITR